MACRITPRASAPMRQRLAAAELRADALMEALSELVNGIEDAGGRDENGDVFDVWKACEALTRTPAEWLALAQAKEEL